MRNVSKLYRKSKHKFCVLQLLPENRGVYALMCSNFVELCRPQMTLYGAWALHDGQLNLKTHTQNTKYLMLFHCKNGYAPQCYICRSCLNISLNFSRKMLRYYFTLDLSSWWAHSSSFFQFAPYNLMPHITATDILKKIIYPTKHHYD
jgi:hypothetical protein